MSVLPSNVIGSWMSCSPAPPIDAFPSTVSGEPRISKPWLTPQEKSPATVTSPPDSDASVSVRSCSWVPPGMPVTTVRAGNLTAGMVTLSPFCGTEWLAQFMGSPQVEPSPSPVHVWLDDALAATGARATVPVARMPVNAAAAILSQSFACAGAVMVTSHGGAGRRGELRGRRCQSVQFACPACKNYLLITLPDTFRPGTNGPGLPGRVGHHIGHAG